MSKVAVVTGGTSGIGKQTALALKAAGYTVYELSRRAQGVEGLHHLVADITREELVDAAIGEVLRQEGHIDVVVNELRPYGVTVCAVQPGDIHTGFTAAREKTIDGDDVYGGRISRSVARMEHDEQTGMDPAKAGAFIAKVAMKQRVKPIYTIRFDYQFLALLTRILPYRFLNWLIGVIYGK